MWERADPTARPFTSLLSRRSLGSGSFSLGSLWRSLFLSGELGDDDNVLLSVEFALDTLGQHQVGGANNGSGDKAGDVNLDRLGDRGGGSLDGDGVLLATK